MNLKSKDILVRIGEGSDLEIKLMKCSPLDFTMVQALPDYRHVLSRRWSIMQNYPVNLLNRAYMVKQELAWELWYDWIYANIPPVAINTIMKKLDQIFTNVDKLMRTGHQKRGPTWRRAMEKLRLDLDNGLDLRSFHSASNADLIEEFGIEVGDEEEKLYEDNCIPVDGKCVRKMFITGVDPAWLKDAQERQEKLEKKTELGKRKQARIDKDKAKLERLKAKENPPQETAAEEEHEDESLERKDSNEYFKAPLRAEPSKVVKQTKKSFTRSSSNVDTDDLNNNDNETFPKRKVRTSFKDIDIDIIEVMVSMESIYSVEQRKVAPLLAYIMNKLAGQSWQVPLEEASTEETDSEDEERGDLKRKRKEIRDLTFVLPTRSTLRKKLEDASLLNFKYVAQTIQDTHNVGGTVTSGWDDTTKAAGHRVHDAKSGRVTCVTSVLDSDGQPKKLRQSFTTGFHPNISHKGEDAAITVKSVVGQMAVLCGVQFEDMFQFLDFFMNDRAGDSDTMLDNLGVTEERRLKCNAHPLLCVQNSVDKIFKDKETVLGTNKLISTDAGHVFSSPSSSIFTLGLIAFAKFLSPSHAQESVSLYRQYKQFLKEDSEDEQSETREKSAILLGKGFQKFSSNRFGRVLALAEIFIENKEMLIKFYDEQVDQHANKLFLACFAYLRSPWFNLCCEIGAAFYKSVILPIKAAIGIDEFRDKPSVYRSWSGMKKFYSELLQSLSTVAQPSAGMTGTQRLKASVAGSIHAGLQHQLAYMKFFSEDSVSEETEKKQNDAPLTNSGCESNFSQLDLECRRGSGQTKLETMSDRHMVKGNRYFDTDQWKQMPAELKQKQWKSSRSSKEAKIVKYMKKEFLEKVKDAESIANKERIRKKQKKNEKCLLLLEQVKLHGGPISMNDLNKLDQLSEKELLSEVRYLRQTVAPNIREKRKIGSKFVRFSLEELKNQILNVLKPENEYVEDIDQLLLTSLSDQANNDAKSNEKISADDQNIGSVALLEGPLSERRVGLVISEETVQLYNFTRYGFEPDDVSVSYSDWKVISIIEDYDFITRRTGVYLRCSVSKTDLS